MAILVAVIFVVGLVFSIVDCIDTEWWALQSTAVADMSKRWEQKAQSHAATSSNNGSTRSSSFAAAPAHSSRRSADHSKGKPAATSASFSAKSSITPAPFRSHSLDQPSRRATTAANRHSPLSIATVPPPKKSSPSSSASQPASASSKVLSSIKKAGTKAGGELAKISSSPSSCKSSASATSNASGELSLVCALSPRTTEGLAHCARFGVSL